MRKFIFNSTELIDKIIRFIFLLPIIFILWFYVTLFCEQMLSISIVVSSVIFSSIFLPLSILIVSKNLRGKLSFISHLKHYLIKSGDAALISTGRHGKVLGVLKTKEQVKNKKELKTFNRLELFRRYYFAINDHEFITSSIYDVIKIINTKN